MRLHDRGQLFRRNVLWNNFLWADSCLVSFRPPKNLYEVVEAEILESRSQLIEAAPLLKPAQKALRFLTLLPLVYVCLRDLKVEHKIFPPVDNMLR